MIQTQQIIIKTCGLIKEEFQQLVSGITISKQLNIPVLFLSSKAFVEEFREYFSYKIDFIQLCDIVNTTYMYNPSVQEENLNKMVKGDEYAYFIYEAKNEFKRSDMSIIDYIRIKSTVHNELFKSIYDYVFPQLDMLLDNSKINVGLSYDTTNISKVYDLCNVNVYNYIDVSNKTSLKKQNITSYEFSDDLLQFIILSMCDMMIGDSCDILNYEAAFRNRIMIHNIYSGEIGCSSNIVPNQVIYNNDCMFPNSQLLLKYI